MILTIDEFYTQAREIVAAFNAFVELRGLKGEALVDHLCYKCDSNETFVSIRALLEAEAVFSYQSIISNRRIAYIKLKKPIETDLGPIYYVELSDQKPDGSQVSMFDHIEIYPIAFSNLGAYAEFIATLRELGVKMTESVRPHHTTYNIMLNDHFELKLSSEPLLEKIIRDEMK